MSEARVIVSDFILQLSGMVRAQRDGERERLSLLTDFLKAPTLRVLAILTSGKLRSPG